MVKYITLHKVHFQFLVFDFIIETKSTTISRTTTTNLTTTTTMVATTTYLTTTSTIPKAASLQSITGIV